VNREDLPLNANRMLHSLLVRQQITYHGSELRSGWIAENFGLHGDAIVAFVGPCRVPTEHLVDLEDQRAGAVIVAARMLHFIAEQAPADLAVAVLRQRLFVALVAELLRAEGVTEGLSRSGDDIFVNERKLTVSIATISPRSGLIHLGINVDPAGAPVPASGLQELGIDPWRFAERLLDAYVQEMAGIAHAQTKVRTVP